MGEASPSLSFSYGLACEAITENYCKFSKITRTFKKKINWVKMHGRRQREAEPPPTLDFHTWYFSIFFLLFFSLCYFQCFFAFFSVFFRCPPPGKGLIVLFFGLFCYFSDFFSLAPLLLEVFLLTPQCNTAQNYSLVFCFFWCIKQCENTICEC